MNQHPIRPRTLPLALGPALVALACGPAPEIHSAEFADTVLSSVSHGTYVDQTPRQVPTGGMTQMSSNWALEHINGARLDVSPLELAAAVQAANALLEDAQACEFGQLAQGSTLTFEDIFYASHNVLTERFKQEMGRMAGVSLGPDTRVRFVESDGTCPAVDPYRPGLGLQSALAVQPAGTSGQLSLLRGNILELPDSLLVSVAAQRRWFSQLPVVRMARVTYAGNGMSILGTQVDEHALDVERTTLSVLITEAMGRIHQLGHTQRMPTIHQMNEVLRGAYNAAIPRPYPLSVTVVHSGGASTVYHIQAGMDAADQPIAVSCIEVGGLRALKGQPPPAGFVEALRAGEEAAYCALPQGAGAPPAPGVFPAHAYELNAHNARRIHHGVTIIPLDTALYTGIPEQPLPKALYIELPALPVSFSGGKIRPVVTPRPLSCTDSTVICSWEATVELTSINYGLATQAISPKLLSGTVKTRGSELEEMDVVLDDAASMSRRVLAYEKHDDTTCGAFGSVTPVTIFATDTPAALGNPIETSLPVLAGVSYRFRMQAWPAAKSGLVKPEQQARCLNAAGVRRLLAP